MHVVIPEVLLIEPSSVPHLNRRADLELNFDFVRWVFKILEMHCDTIFACVGKSIFCGESRE